MTDPKVINKIKKLVTLSNDKSNNNENLTAYKKAKELIERHKLKASDFGLFDIIESIERSVEKKKPIIEKPFEYDVPAYDPLRDRIMKSNNTGYKVVYPEEYTIIERPQLSISEMVKDLVANDDVKFIIKESIIILIIESVLSPGIGSVVALGQFCLRHRQMVKEGITALYYLLKEFREKPVELEQIKVKEDKIREKHIKQSDFKTVNRTVKQRTNLEINSNERLFIR
jgi:Protein of unknown function (DUF2786)